MSAAPKTKRAPRKRGRRFSKPVEAATFDVPPLATLELAGRLDRVAKLVTRGVSDVARQHGATPTQLHVVERLARSPGGLTAKQLAQALAIQPGSLTGTIDGLEKRGIVQRQPVPGDGRQHQVVLLPGAKELVELLPEVDAAISASLGALGGEVAAGLNEVMTDAERAIRSQRAVPTPAVLKRSKAENSDEERDEAAAPAAEEAAQPAQEVAEAKQEAAATPEPETKPVVEPPPFARPEHPPEQRSWEPPPRREQSEGSIGRGLFRIASRVISAAEGRRRGK